MTGLGGDGCSDCAELSIELAAERGKLSKAMAGWDQAIARAEKAEAKILQSATIDSHNECGLSADGDGCNTMAELREARAEVAELKRRKVVPFDFLITDSRSVALWGRIRGLPWGVSLTPDDVWGLCKGITETIAEPLARADAPCAAGVEVDS